jgi:hypothetical protein
MDSFAQSGKISDSLWRQKDQRLLSLGGHIDENTLFADLAGPGFYPPEPIGGWWIGGAAQEGNDQDVVRGLALRKVGMNPEAVARQEIGHFRDWQRDALTLDMDVDFGANQIERWSVSTGSRRSGKEKEEYR